MSSLVSDQLKNTAAQAMDNLHDTYKRNIIVVNELANANVIDPDSFNPLSDNQNPDVTYTANKVTIDARIKYLDKADSETELIFNGKGDSKAVSTSIRQDYGVVRIKVEKQYTDLVKNSTKIIVDGMDCQLLYNFSPLTLFNTNYVTFYLSRQL